MRTTIGITIDEAQRGVILAHLVGGDLTIDEAAQHDGNIVWDGAERPACLRVDGTELGPCHRSFRASDRTNASTLRPHRWAVCRCPGA